MDPQVRGQVERIHAGPLSSVIAVTGGGSAALGWLLGVPGASRTVLEAVVPYSLSSLAGFLGDEPAKIVGLDTAQAMARAAYRRAIDLRTGGASVVGIGSTSAIVTDRPKKGDHASFASAWTEQGVTTYGVTLVKGLRDRDGEEEVVSRLVLRALAEAAGVSFDLPLALDDREEIQESTNAHGDPIRRLIDGDAETVTASLDGTLVADEPVRGGVLAGSFDPFHEGHESLAQTAAAILEDTVTFELSVTNVDKPPLEDNEVRERLAQFRGHRTAVLTHAPTFHDKAKLFPGCTFVIGWDTAVRLVEPRYYVGKGSRMLEALVGIRLAGCRFLVAGRVNRGNYRSLGDVTVPAEFEDMFTPIPETLFRRDISSTDLRFASSRP